VNLTAGASASCSRSSWIARHWAMAFTRETYIAALATCGIVAHLILRFACRSEPCFYNWPLCAVLGLGGIPLLFDLIRKILAGDFGSDLLAGISIATSVFLGEYLAGSIVVLMLSGGTALEQFAMGHASAVLNALSRRMPHIAHRKTAAGMMDVELTDVIIGDILTVLPHEICPVDGTVVDGRGSMDESYLTGEPFQISKVPGSSVLSGAVNGETALEISVGKLASDSRYAKIMRVMQEAEQNRPHFRRIADRLGVWYTVFAVTFALVGWVIGGDPSRFLAVLVIATPCPLLIAIPIVIIGAISTSARHSIIIKRPGMLEQIDSCRTVIFDKTGTLTYGKPALTEILPAPGISRPEILQLAATLEQYSKHPLAAAILSAARSEKKELGHATQISERPGEGLLGIVDGRKVQITGRGHVTIELPPAAPGLECILLVDDDYAGLLRFHDEPRLDSRGFVLHLQPRHNVTKIMLLSGDRAQEVHYLAGQVGITEALYGKSPEEKVEIVRHEASAAPTLFLGDGINDAPAMQAATVGIAFGQTSDITAEAADAVVLEASLGLVDELIHIGRRMRTIALQCAIGGMGLSIIGMSFAAAGYLRPVAGAIAQEVIDVLAILNALRMVLPGGDLKDI
jgi:heavy metal translocating P-type ATPase